MFLGKKDEDLESYQRLIYIYYFVIVALETTALFDTCVGGGEFDSVTMNRRE